MTKIGWTLASFLAMAHPRAGAGRPARRLRHHGLGPARGPGAARSAAPGHRQRARGRHHHEAGGAGVLRPGSRLPPRVRLDRSGALVPRGAAPRPGPGARASRPEPRLLRARRPEGGAHGLRAGGGARGEGERARAAPDRAAREAARRDRAHRRPGTPRRVQARRSTRRSRSTSARRSSGCCAATRRSRRPRGAGSGATWPPPRSTGRRCR